MRIFERDSATGSECASARRTCDGKTAITRKNASSIVTELIQHRVVHAIDKRMVGRRDDRLAQRLQQRPIPRQQVRRLNAVGDYLGRNRRQRDIDNRVVEGGDDQRNTDENQTDPTVGITPALASGICIQPISNCESGQVLVVVRAPYLT